MNDTPQRLDAVLRHVAQTEPPNDVRRSLTIRDFFAGWDARDTEVETEQQAVQDLVDGLRYELRKEKTTAENSVQQIRLFADVEQRKPLTDYSSGYCDGLMKALQILERRDND